MDIIFNNPPPASTGWILLLAPVLGAFVTVGLTAWLVTWLVGRKNKRWELRHQVEFRAALVAEMATAAYTLELAAAVHKRKMEKRHPPAAVDPAVAMPLSCPTVWKIMRLLTVRAVARIVSLFNKIVTASSPATSVGVAPPAAPSGTTPGNEQALTNEYRNDPVAELEAVKTLDEVYIKSRSDGKAIESRLKSHFACRPTVKHGLANKDDSREEAVRRVVLVKSLSELDPWESWHAAMDCATVIYFDALGRPKDTICKNNSWGFDDRYHSGLTEEELARESASDFTGEAVKKDDRLKDARSQLAAAVAAASNAVLRDEIVVPTAAIKVLPLKGTRRWGWGPRRK